MDTSRISAIQEWHIQISTRNQIPQLVEWPLVACVESLFDKGIQTFMSSANGKNIYINIYYDSLSPQNKAIAEQVIKEYGWSLSLTGHSSRRPLATFSLPPIITPLDYVEKWWCRLADQFESQSSRKKFISRTYLKADLEWTFNRRPRERYKNTIYYTVWENDITFN